MAELKKTPLHDTHEKAGAKMVDFGGWSMPVQYKEGILAEHEAVRTKAGVFDVSHMGEIDFKGPKAREVVNHLVTNDVLKLTTNKALYTPVCYPDGGIVDDCIVYQLDDEHLRIVVNASNIEKDEAFFREHAGEGCEIENLSEKFALLAVQGPEARTICANLAGESLLSAPSFGLAWGEIEGTPILAARTGYTGEDGFELFVPADDAVKVWDKLVNAGVKPAGLGARDTLRLEARLCLYGNDIDKTTDPYSAILGWTVKLDSGDFVGKKALETIKAKGPKEKLIGFRIEGRGIARAGAEIVDAKGEVVGRVTSGSTGPTVGYAIGMGYVKADFAAQVPVDGGDFQIRQRGKELQAKRVKGPFYRRPNA